MKLDKILAIGMWVIVIISAIFMVALISNINDNPADPGMNRWLNTSLSWTYILFGIAVAIMIVFAIVQSFGDKKAAKGALVALVGAVVVVGGSYLLSSNELPTFFGVERFIEDGTLTLPVSKWIDTAFIVTYILFFATIAVTVFWAVKNIVKR